ncbi:MAG: hypothetical protein V9G12_21060 [Microthrixaceae bacterium]
MRRVTAMAAVGAVAVVAAVVLGVGGGADPLAPTDGTSAVVPASASASATPTTTLPERAALPMLVLYDTSGAWSTVGQTDAILSANLLGHFGPVTRLPIGEYTAGMAASFGGVLYVGTTFDEPIPTVFLDDVVGGSTPIVWAGLNIWQLGDRLTAGGYGFTPGLLDAPRWSRCATRAPSSTAPHPATRTRS